jgi:mRNA interferase MazF
MKKGDIILLSFPFTDLTGSKTRPALILAESLSDIVVCFITTQIKYTSDFDISIVQSERNGLKKPSIIRLNKIATINKDLVLGLLGILEERYLIRVDENLRLMFKL